jgi:hypothetical protein
MEISLTDSSLQTVSSASADRKHSSISGLRSLIRDGASAESVDNYISQIQSTFPQGAFAVILNDILSFAVQNDRDDLIDILIRIGAVSVNTALNRSISKLLTSIENIDEASVNSQLRIIPILLRYGADTTVIENDLNNLIYQNGLTVPIYTLYNLMLERGYITEESVPID